MKHEGPEGCQANATGHHNDISSFGLLDGPVRAVWSPHANHLASAQSLERACHRTDCPDGVDHLVGSLGIAANGYRHLSTPMDIEHIELTRLKREMGVTLDGQ